MTNARTVKELKDGGWQRKSVKQELRDNLVARLRRGEAFLPGIVGYEDTVVPQIENAVLSGQDLIFLGERGQAKTRMARMLIGLLDDAIPALAGCEINDDPLAPDLPGVPRAGGQAGRRRGIAWIPRDRRYGEKLATPDITIADLIGEVDPIKVAEGRYLSDELTIHYGLLPRTHRGHLRDQRAAGPGRADPGRPPQHHGGARRPDPRLQGAAAARPLRGRQRQPRGLHEPRAHHHAAEGPLRLPDPHALPQEARPTRSPSWTPSGRRSPPTACRRRARST